MAPVRQQEGPVEQFQTERDNVPLSCDEDLQNGSRETELFYGYNPGHSLTPVVMQNAKENPGLSTATTADFRGSDSANMLSETNHRTSDLVTLEPTQPTKDQCRQDSDSGAMFSQYLEDQTAQDEGEGEPDFLLEVKMEEEEDPEQPELQDIIDMSSFTDGIYICEVSL